MSDFTGRSTYSLEGTIENDGFFPDLDLSAFQREWRVANDYRREAIELHLTNALFEINRQLNAFKLDKQELGYSELSEVPQYSSGSTKSLIHQYYRAVYAHAKAYLLREFATINRREQGEHLARESEESHDALLEQSNLAIRYFLGRSNIEVDLL
jgi:hypothetical protein